MLDEIAAAAGQKPSAGTCVAGWAVTLKCDKLDVTPCDPLSVLSHCHHPTYPLVTLSLVMMHCHSLWHMPVLINTHRNMLSLSHFL